MSNRVTPYRVPTSQKVYQTWLLCCYALLAGVVFSALGSWAWGAEPDVSPEAALVELGLEIFTDRQVLSFEKTMSCATCHSLDPKLGFSDGLPVLVGLRGTRGYVFGSPGIRNTISLAGCKYVEHGPCNSDGRVEGKGALERMILQACTDPVVMAMPSIQEVVNRANAEPRYKYLAALAGGSADNWKNHTITEEEIRKSLVSFVKKIDSPDLPADRWAAGLKTNLPQSALAGGEVFRAHCMACHKPEHGWSDNKFHNIGIASRQRNGDLGRAAITGNSADNYCFRTPRLIEVARHAPYMHDGSLKTLREVVAFKAKGGRYKVNGETLHDPKIDPLISAIDLSATEIDNVVDFLEIAFQGDNLSRFDNPHQSGLTADEGSK